MSIRRPRTIYIAALAVSVALALAPILALAGLRNDTHGTLGTATLPLVTAGSAADGTAVAGNPTLIAGQDGANTQSIRTDGAGRLEVVSAAGTSTRVEGVAADGTATSGNPVLAGASDGTNTQTILSDTSGRTIVVGAAVGGNPPAGNPVLMGASDGTSVRTVLTDTNGRPNVVGPTADGTAVLGSPLLMGGQDGTNVQSISVDTVGRVSVVGAAGAGVPVTGNPVLVAGTDGGTIRTLAVGSNGQVYIVLTISSRDGASRAAARNLSGTVTAIKATEGSLGAIQVTNNQGAAAYVQIFNAVTGAVTLGTTVPDIELLVAANSQLQYTFPPQGAQFSSAISVASTTASGGGTGSATGVHVYTQYQ